MPTLDFDTLDSAAVYRLLVGCVQPRPIAFVSTVDAAGRANLAPYSFFNVASVDPPILAFAPQYAASTGPGDGIKDTLSNLQETEECVVHIVSHRFREAMNLTSASWPRGMSEFEMAGFTPVASRRVRPPRAAEASAAFECRLDQIISWGERPRAGSLVLARILAAHIDDTVYFDGKIDQHALDTIGRMGGPAYTRARDGYFEMPRPTPEDMQRARDGVGVDPAGPETTHGNG